MSNNQNPTLESLFKELLEKVTSLKIDHDNFIFSSKTLPVPPPALETDKLLIHKLKHSYNDYYQVDKLWFSASKEMCGYWGLLILAVLFHEKPDRVELRLTDPDSDIKNLRVDYKYYDYEGVVGYQSRPFALNYYPARPGTVDKHPWVYRSYSKIDLYDLPCFYLTNSEEFVKTEEEWENRDTVTGFGNDEGSILLAELLLNLAHVENDTLEIELEGEAGYRGVGITSAEVNIFLPGSLGYDGPEN